MREGYDNLMTIAQAAKQKSCTRQTIYKAIKEGLLNTKQIGGRSFVVNDESFQDMPIKKSIEPSLKQGLALIEKRVGNLEKTIEETIERLKSIEEKLRKVAVTKVRYKQG